MVSLDEHHTICYYTHITNGILGYRKRINGPGIKNIKKKDGDQMVLKIDFDSEEALYTQLCNQIICGIAMDVLHDGDSLPSVRQLADEIGINMHTVNKAYAVLKQEGFLRLDRRRGAVIALDMDKLRTMEEMKNDLALIVARGICKNVGRDEIHSLVDQIYDEFGGQA